MDGVGGRRKEVKPAAGPGEDTPRSPAPGSLCAKRVGGTRLGTSTPPSSEVL